MTADPGEHAAGALRERAHQVSAGGSVRVSSHPITMHCVQYGRRVGSEGSRRRGTLLVPVPVPTVLVKLQRVWDGIPEVPLPAVCVNLI